MYMCNKHACKIIVKNYERSSLVVQWVKDLVLLVQQLRSLLWLGFNPLPRKFHMPWAQTKKKIVKELLFWQANNLACHSFMDADIRHKAPGPEIKVY